MKSAQASVPIAESAGHAVAVCRAALVDYTETPASASVRARVDDARRAAAQTVAHIALRTDGDIAVLRQAMELQSALATSGIYDHAVPPANLDLAQQLTGQGLTGLVAASLLAPAWQWPEAPACAAVPEELVAFWVAWLFYVPQGFCEVGDADAYAAHYLRRLEELDRYVRSRPRAKVTQAALGAFVATANCIPLYFTEGSLRRHMEVRGHLLTAWETSAREVSPPRLATPRAGRRLRVGFVSRHFGAQTETYTTLPTFERLDPGRFEVLLFAHHYRDTELERYARSRAAGFTHLPESVDQQLEILKTAELDIVVFGTNVTAVCHEVTRLALHRIAPLQVVNNSSCTTTGLPEIDLYVSGTATEHDTAPAHFTERLGLLRGPAHAFNYEADRQGPTGQWTRAALGLPEDAVVFVSAANFYKITPEMQHAWARLLAAVPGSRLLVHPFNPNWASQYPIKRFCAAFDGVLAEHGVAADRLSVSSVRFPSRADVGALLSVGDLYLDTFPFSGVNSLIDPLEAAVPMIVREGETFRSRMGAALLRELGLSELVVSNDEACHEQVVRLARDGAARAELRVRIQATMERLPLFLDSLAASDAFGALLERAYDELVEQGRDAFRHARAPIVAPDVAAPAARRARGLELMASGDSARASDYFLAAIQHDERNADLWRDLSVALRASGRVDEAVQCLQTSLQLAPHARESWRLLVDLAQALGHGEIQREATAMLERLDAPAGRARVLLYTDDPDAGGVAHYNHSLLMGLVEAGYEVTCAQSESETPLVAQQRAAGVSHRWISYDTKKEFGRALTDKADAERIFADERPDLIVFSDCCPLSNLAARQVALQRGIPYVVVVGFVGAYLADRFQQALPTLAAQYTRAAAVVAVSQENLDLLHRRFGLPAGAGTVIHYGRPARYFAPRDAAVRARLRAELALPEDAVVCFTAARLTGIKGHVFLLEAARALLSDPVGRRLHLVWAGEGELRTDLERLVVEAGLSGRVHLLGHRWDVADWYDAADIFALPSELEGMPLAIMEAMAKALPVVATAVSGIPEELGDTGQLLPAALVDRAGLVQQLTKTLRHWTRDEPHRHAVGAAGRRRAEAMFRESMMIERTVALVRSHLAPSPAVVPA